MPVENEPHTEFPQPSAISPPPDVCHPCDGLVIASMTSWEADSTMLSVAIDSPLAAQSSLGLSHQEPAGFGTKATEISFPWHRPSECPAHRRPSSAAGKKGIKTTKMSPPRISIALASIARHAASK